MVSAELLTAFAVNGVVLGSILALSAIGLTLVYGILNLTNFAHGDFMTLGAYSALFFNLLLVSETGQSTALTYAIALALLIALVPALELGARKGLGEARSRHAFTRVAKWTALLGLLLLAARADLMLGRLFAANLVEITVGMLVLAAAWGWGWWLLSGRGWAPRFEGRGDGNPLVKPAAYFGALLVLGALVPFILSGALGSVVRALLWITAVIVGGAWFLGLRGRSEWDEDTQARYRAWLKGAGLVAAFLLAGAVLDLVLGALFSRVPGAALWDAALALFGLALLTSIVGSATGRLGRMEGVALYAAAGVIALVALFRWLGPDAGLPRALTSPVLLPAVMAMAIVPLVSVGLDALVWKKLRRERATVLTLIIVSIGIALALRHLLVMRFGGGLRRYAGTSLTRIQFTDLIIITRTQLLIVITALVLILLVHVLLKYTRVGKGLRALSDNVELARVTGIDVDRMILYVWVIGGVLTGLAGVLLAMAVNVNPNLGFQFLLPVFAAVILGGIGSPYGAMAGGLVIGIAMETSAAWAPAYRTAVAFLILIIVLLIRPQGILGGKV